MKKMLLSIFILLGFGGYSQESITGISQKISGEIEEKIVCITKIADEEEQENLENLILLNKGKVGSKSGEEIIDVRTVIHIIHKGEEIGTGTNISDEQVYSAINKLNKDFRNRNGELEGLDTGLQFYLATCDPDGNPTNGINRVNGSALSSTYANQGITAGNGLGASEVMVKNWSRWPNQEFYNIWVVSEIENNNGGSGIQGYAYFPTSSIVDGTVLLYNAFGIIGEYALENNENFNLKSYTNKNKTLTHEIGHGFGLFHTFQGNSCQESNCALQGDRVCDTPPTIQNSNGNYPACGGTQQVWNYMDYTGQNFKTGFTQGQVDRMQATSGFSRANLTSQALCIGEVTSVNFEIVSQNIPLCADNNSDVFIKLTNNGINVLQRATFTVNISGEPIEYKWAGCLGPNQSDKVYMGNTNFPIGINEISIILSEVNNISIDIIEKIKEVEVIENQFGYVKVKTDIFGGQITWNITDTETDEIVRSGGPYSNFQAGSLHLSDICLPNGCYTFNVTDIMGDGICCTNGDGYIKLFESNDNELVNFTNFGSEDSYSFCVDFIEDVPTDTIPTDTIVVIPEFKLLNFGGKCGNYEGKIYLEFNVENTQNVSGYKIDHINSETGEYITSYYIDGDGYGYVNGNQTGYSMLINSFPNISTFILYKIENGISKIIWKTEIQCDSRNDRCGYTIINGKIIPNDPRLEVLLTDPTLFNEYIGGGIQNLPYGLYILNLVTKEGEKVCTSKLFIPKT